MLCHGETVCPEMRADLDTNDKMHQPGHKVTEADKDAAAAMLAAVMTGRCVHCKRPVR
jgi:hypothetical protein